MIWAPHWASSQEAESPLVEQIAEQIRGICGDSLSLAPAQVGELARAVAWFVEKDRGGYFTDNRHLAALASRALASVGERVQARRLLVLGTGMVRSAEWIVSGEDSMWVMDLKAVTLLDRPGLELVLFRSLDLVLGTVAEVWDRTSGRGVLGLLHVSQTASALIGDTSERAVLKLGLEIKGRCAERLSSIGASRGWTHVPVVMDLDVR
jgi:hypothetical protein